MERDGPGWYWPYGVRKEAPPKRKPKVKVVAAPAPAPEPKPRPRPRPKPRPKIVTPPKRVPIYTEEEMQSILRKARKMWEEDE